MYEIVVIGTSWGGLGALSTVNGALRLSGGRDFAARGKTGDGEMARVLRKVGVRALQSKRDGGIESGQPARRAGGGSRRGRARLRFLQSLLERPDAGRREFRADAGHSGDRKT